MMKVLKMLGHPRRRGVPANPPHPSSLEHFAPHDATLLPQATADADLSPDSAALRFRRIAPEASINSEREEGAVHGSAHGVW